MDGLDVCVNEMKSARTALDRAIEATNLNERLRCLQLACQSSRDAIHWIHEWRKTAKKEQS